MYTRFLSLLSKTLTYAGRHKIISGIIVLLLIGGGYWGYTALAAGSAGTQYVLARVTQAPLVVSVTGSGQVSAQDTLSLSPQASGKITYLGVTPGQSVKAGTLIAELDMTTAAQAVTTARQNLKGAQISYQQALTSSGTSITSDQNSLQSAQTANVTALSTVFTNLPTVMNGLDTVLHAMSTVPSYTAQQNIDAYANYLHTPESSSYNNQVKIDFAAASAAYKNIESEYTATDPNTLTPEQLQTLDSHTIAADNIIETALKDSLAYYNYVNDAVVSAKITAPPQISSQITSLTSYQSTITGNDSSISNAETSLLNAEQTATQDTQSLGNSTTPLTVQSAELNVEKAQESLNEALTNESYYVVRAPFDGVIATVPVNKYDQASSGTTIATLITNEEYADLSLNETDAAKVKVGQPATVTFDAISGLTMPGSVAVMDPVGTVTQGVVTYDVKISFSQQDSRIKPGMTATAVITTATEAHAIQVPSAAIETSGNTTTVQVATLLNASTTLANAYGGTRGGTGTRRTRSATSTAAFVGGFGTSTGTSTASSPIGGMSGTTPFTTRSITVPASQVTLKTITVTTGISNDTMTEILSGLTPGDYVVTATQKAASSATKSTAASATSILGGGTGTRGLGGGFTGGGGSGRSTGGTGVAPRTGG